MIALANNGYVLIFILTFLIAGGFAQRPDSPPSGSGNSSKRRPAGVSAEEVREAISKLPGTPVKKSEPVDDTPPNPNATAEVEETWVDHSVYENDVKGMRIHVRFSINGSKGEPCTATIYFYFQSGKALKDFNGRYKTVGGNVSAYEKFTPRFENSEYADFQIFMPYAELHMETGEFELKYLVEIHNKNGRSLGESKYYPFTFTR